ncbi:MULTISPECIES: OsmC family peroxiredoxin [Brachybacterium]|uniref:Osmotically inducible protein OsmC n=1 Tax=Brachybacterium fresconis TaxID=173363 RepID=A0ABS4YNG8_9MICO|nr:MULTISPECIES: OsmC family peroxiredoxin [Brachybacterium]MBP2409947.1 osmotically inducible protein OsmC [Brachybacterium fresconis]MDN5686728.1 OsmC family peroxiredoxin [Brachybacterium sp.]
MPRTVISTASTTWQGDLPSGNGTTTLGTSQLGSFPVNWKARAEEGEKGTTSPEELLGAAHATCYAMAFSNGLAENGTPPTSVDSSAKVSFNIGEGGITGIELTVKAVVEDLDEADFQRLAEDAKQNCPVSQALKGVDITLNATLA